MGFWTLVEVSLFAVLEVLIICLVGAFMATEYFNIFTAETRKNLTKIVLAVFLPCIMFYNLIVNVTLPAFISWWFIPINICITNLLGGLLGWVLVKLARPDPYLSGIVISICSTGNVANVLLIIVPAVCSLNGSPFQNAGRCGSVGHSYVALSMACCGVYSWTCTYHLMRSSARIVSGEGDTCHLQTPLLEDGAVTPAARNVIAERALSYRRVILRSLHRILDPALVASITAVAIGSTPLLRTAVVGEKAPLKFVLDIIQWLGNATVPSITLILGGNLSRGLYVSRIQTSLILGMICVRYVLIPAAGVWIVAAAAKLGFLISDPIFRYVVLIHYCLPPAMQIGTMAQNLQVGEAECWGLFLWMYVASVTAVTVWSALYMHILPMLSS